jgi:hypothetical protein
MVQSLVDEGNSFLKKNGNPYNRDVEIDGQMLREEFLDNVKKVARNNPVQGRQNRNDDKLEIEDYPEEYDTSDLPIKKVHVYLHGLTQHPRYLKNGY